MLTRRPKEKEELSKKLAMDMIQFAIDGGEIEKVGHGVSGIQKPEQRKKLSLSQLFATSPDAEKQYPIMSLQNFTMLCLIL